MNASLRRLALLATVCWALNPAVGVADEISPESLPQIVQSSIEAAVPGIVIDEASVEEEDEGLRYELHGMAVGLEVEAVVFEDGTILHLSTEEEEDDEPLDSDDDGLDDTTELESGLDPYDRDTDGDLYPDGFETEKHSDPRDSTSVPEILSLKCDPVTSVMSLELSTFEDAEFTIEQCTGDFANWTQFGSKIVGDGSVYRIVIPQSNQIPRCFFRTTVSPKENNGNDTGHTGPCRVPASLVGYDIVIERDGDETIRLCFVTEDQGEEVEEEDDEIEFTPFGYSYQQIDDCTIRLTLTFVTSDGYETEEYDLTFDAEGNGSYTSQRHEGGNAEDPHSGSFTAQNHGSNP